MTQRKLIVKGYYGQRTDIPFNFIPNGINLKLLIHKVDGYKIEHDISVDEHKVTQFLDYNKPQSGCGSIFGMKALI